MCASVRMDIGCSIPPFEVGATTLVSGTNRGADGVGVAVRSVLADCGRSLASWDTLGDGESIGSGLGTSLGAYSTSAQDRHC